MATAISIEITARAGTRAVVTGQSATRIHPAARPATRPSNGPSRSRTTPAWSSCPARRSRSGVAAIFSAAASSSRRAARLIWGDIWLPGRYDRGEPVGAVPVRADRPGLRGPPRRSAGLPRPLPMGWPLDPGRRRLVLRRSPGLGQPVRRRARAREPPRGRPAPPTRGLPARHRRELHPMVRPPVGCHGRPRADGLETGRKLDRRARRSPVAPRLERPCPQPLVLHACGKTMRSIHLAASSEFDQEQNLTEVSIPIVLKPQLGDGVVVARHLWGGKDGVRARVDIAPTRKQPTIPQNPK